MESKDAMHDRINPHRLEKRIAYLEANRRFVQNALEMALSLGDFQHQISEHHPPDLIFRETEKRVERLLDLEARGFYAVDPTSSDMSLVLCEPTERTGCLEAETAFMIEKGLVAWAIREQRGVFILSRDQTRYFLVHIIATHCRLRGLFLGMLPTGQTTVPDTSLDLLSIILRYAANAMESVEYYRLLENQKQMLQNEVNQKTRELIHYERQLRRSQKMEAIGTLAGGVAHELNNILTGIVSYPDLILLQTPKESPLRKPLNTIKDSGRRAAAIVQDLLTLARRGVNVNEGVDLNAVITAHLNSAECHQVLRQHPQVRLDTHLAPHLPNISGSPLHLTKVVHNLLCHAAQSMPEGGRIELTTESRELHAPVSGYERIPPGSYAILRVADTGGGTAKEDAERLFEPFYTKKVMGRNGTGMGMALVWGAVKDHEGYIDLENAREGGTVIRLYFPTTGQTLVPANAGSSVETIQGQGERIVVIDDVAEQREIAEMILTELGYRVTTVSSGEEAVTFLEKGTADLLVLDMIMQPGMDGLETYRRILQLRPGQRAIIASGFSENDRVKAAQALGAGPYLKKPYTIERLATAVRAELDK